MGAFPDVKCLECPKIITGRKRASHVRCSDVCRNKFALRKQHESPPPSTVARQRAVFCLFERDAFRCCYCGRSPMEDGAKLHLDHIVPVVSGGESVAANLISSCEECNVAKGGRELSADTAERLIAETALRNERAGLRGDLRIKLGGIGR